MSSVFITGATGAVGYELLRELIEKTLINNFYVLVRNLPASKVKLNNLIDYSIKLKKEIFLLEGDITKDSLGLSEEDRAEVVKVEEVYHLAADVSLSRKKKEEIFNVNVNGTKNILNLFKEAPNLKNFFYFSTAFVCGRQRGIIKEDWTKRPDAFRNPYEESKWLAENLVKEYMDRYNLPITIIRPTIIVVTDKERFKETSNQTIYLYGLILKEAAKQQKDNLPIKLIGKETSNFNIITTEDITKILLELRTRKNKKNIYNFANPTNLSAKTFLDSLSEASNLKVKFCFSEKLNINEATETEKLIYNLTKAYFEYNLDDYLFWDTSNTDLIRKDLSIKPKDNIWLAGHVKDYFKEVQDGK